MAAPIHNQKIMTVKKHDEEESKRHVTKQWGLISGIVVFAILLVLPAPTSLSAQGWKTAAVAILMAIWWMTEALPLPVTSLLPLVLFPMLGVLEMPIVAAPYANEVVFLFMGGFLIAVAMERWELHKRVALRLVRIIGASPRRLVLGFMLATAFLSMWISNTAVTTMMLPIILAVGQLLRRDNKNPYNFGIALMLATAYGASIGGIATLIGTPANAVLAGAAQEILGVQIGFLQWMAVGLPISLVLLPIIWVLLVWFLYPPGPIAADAATLLKAEESKLGPLGRGEKIVGTLFVLTALAWLLRSPKSLGLMTIPGIQSWAPAVRDSTIAMTAAVLLFLLPVNWRKGEFILDWRTARKLPWDVLILFGGGLALARAMSDSGLAAWIGSGVGAIGNVSALYLFGIVTTLFVFLTEVTSNTATATIAMPIMAGIAIELGFPPLTLMATAALSTSMAFMLPVATPPNAIVFGSGYLTIAQMVRAGFWMNLIAIGAITVAAVTFIPAILTP